MASRMLSARVPQEVRDGAVVRAAFDGITLSDAVRELLSLYAFAPDGGPLRLWLLERRLGAVTFDLHRRVDEASQLLDAIRELRKENESLRTSLLAMVREEMADVA